MPVMQRNNSIVSSASTVSKQTNVTRCLVQHPDASKTRKIVHVDKTVNPSNRRLKAGDDCTLKGDGRNHVLMKILYCGMLFVYIFRDLLHLYEYLFKYVGNFETCQHQLDVISESEAMNDGNDLH